MSSKTGFLVVIFVIAGFTQCNRTSKPKLDGRIVGGEPADIRDYPYQVSLMYPDVHQCGGSIVHPKYILTAAHCTQGFQPDDIRVRAGSSMIYGGTTKRVARITAHPQFDSDTYDNDLAILELTESLEFGEGISSIELPPQGADVPGGIEGIATGWGRLSENGPLPTQLQRVSLPVLAFEVCQLVYGDQMTPRMICAGYPQGGKDACQGDSGGPFVHNGVQIGITSWGDGCGAVNSPGVYTRVSNFTDYIVSKIVN